ncbi:MAG: hypothetical protein RhofKO_39010 [Rhodothermales bacterium]
MPDAPASYDFMAPVLLDPEVEDGYMKHYIPLPEGIAEALAASKRIIGTLDGHAFRRTIQQRPNGEPCLRFGKSWLRDAGVPIGAVVPVTCGPDPDPDRVDLPDELASALDLDPVGAKAWHALTPGKQRTLAYGIARAKRPETRIRRALAVIADVTAEASK